MNKYTVMYKTMGITLAAGQVEASELSLMTKARATELLRIRHVQKLDSACIMLGPRQAAVLSNPQDPPDRWTWLTIF